MAKDTRGSRAYPQTVLPPLSQPGVTIIAMDRADGLWKASENGAAYIPILTSGGAAGVLQTVPYNATVDITTTAVPPVYTPFIVSPVMTTTLAASRLRIDFYACWRVTGPGVQNVAANWRFRLNGALIPASRGVTDNAVRNLFKPVVFSRVLVPIVAGLQAVVVEWAGFALGANTLEVNPGTLPDLSGAHLILQELPP